MHIFIIIPFFDINLTIPACLLIKTQKQYMISYEAMEKSLDQYYYVE